MKRAWFLCKHNLHQAKQQTVSNGEATGQIVQVNQGCFALLFHCWCTTNDAEDKKRKSAEYLVLGEKSFFLQNSTLTLFLYVIDLQEL